MNENLLVGLVALALVPVIGWRIVQGLRRGRLPIYRTYLERGEGGIRFWALLAVHATMLVLTIVISADLLLGLGLRDRG